MAVGEKVKSLLGLKGKANRSGSERQQPVVSEKFAADTRISFKEELIPTLVSEHKKLLTLHSQILATAKNKNFDETRQLLVIFKDVLVGHLLKENTSLYTYLKHSLKDEAGADLVVEMKQEMDNVGRLITHFVKQSLVNDYEYNDEFIEGFTDIGAALLRRIKNEESYLYSIYLNQANQL